MSNEALNKIQQTHSIFKKITANLNKVLGISFGYMKVFKDGSYYCLMDELDCLQKFVTNVENSSIFCERNVTNCFDGEYNFTLWPKEPICAAMDIYHKYNIWNGITVSKINANYIELYWFTSGNLIADWHKFFIRNKPLLLKFIKYFDGFKTELYVPENNLLQSLFKFNQGFSTNLPKSKYLQEESLLIKKLIGSWNQRLSATDSLKTATNLSLREVEILSIICRGYSVKEIALKLHLSTSTVNTYIERIKHKYGLHFRRELIQFYKDNFQ